MDALWRFDEENANEETRIRIERSFVVAEESYGVFMDLVFCAMKFHWPFPYSVISQPI